ncbi:Aldo/keto reductase [Wilcoxina mikolae CBS 423.85]|nr:Aldo/keto reductase [Wilcoxina mikolae CBS 423.85]
MSTISIPTLKLSNNVSIPILGYGCGTAWYQQPNSPTLDRTLIDAIKTALKIGYRHIDGAETYNNEREIGAAIKESGIPRSELFITTKLWPSVTDPIGRFHQSLKNLGVDYIDLYLLHCPFFSSSSHGTTPEKVWSELESLHTQGLAKAIGVSNFNLPQLRSLLASATIKPATNQIELHPYCYDQELHDFCTQQGIVLTAYGPLSPIVRFSGGPLDPVLERVAGKYGKTPEQVLLKWGVQKGFVVVSTTSKEGRMREFVEAVDGGWGLEEGEVEEITRVGKTYHRRKFWRKEYGEEEQA